MILTTSESYAVVELLLPDASGEEKALLEQFVTAVLEGKDVGRFKGEISPFKQQAYGIVHQLPRAISSRRKDEKLSSKELNKLIDTLESDMVYLVRRVRSDDDTRKISTSRFKSEMKFKLHDAYRKAYDLGTQASGIGQEYPGLVTHQGVDEKRFVDNLFSQEQKYFNKFLDDIIRGESASKSALRVKNYANAVRSVFEASRTLQLPDNSLIHWVLQSGNPCPECRILHRNSPYTKETLPTTPKSGSTRCLAFCYCKLRVTKSTPEEVKRIAEKNRSAQHVLRQLTQSRKSH